MGFKGVCTLLGALLLVNSSFQQQGRRKPSKKEAAPAKDGAVEQLQKQIDNIVQELNLLKEQQALQTVCLKGTKINGKCYLAERARKRYHAASEDCNNLGGVLATPASAHENERLADYLRQSVGPDERVWLGANDMAAEGSWVDQGGLALAYENWDASGAAPPQPDGGAAQNCAVLCGASGGKWLDEQCREERPSVCQFNIV